MENKDATSSQKKLKTLQQNLFQLVNYSVSQCNIFVNTYINSVKI